MASSLSSSSASLPAAYKPLVLGNIYGSAAQRDHDECSRTIAATANAKHLDTICKQVREGLNSSKLESSNPLIVKAHVGLLKDALDSAISRIQKTTACPDRKFFHKTEEVNEAMKRVFALHASQFQDAGNQIWLPLQVAIAACYGKTLNNQMLIKVVRALTDNGFASKIKRNSAAAEPCLLVDTEFETLIDFLVGYLIDRQAEYNYDHLPASHVPKMVHAAGNGYLAEYLKHIKYGKQLLTVAYATASSSSSSASAYAPPAPALPASASASAPPLASAQSSPASASASASANAPAAPVSSASASANAPACFTQLSLTSMASAEASARKAVEESNRKNDPYFNPTNFYYQTVIYNLVQSYQTHLQIATDLNKKLINDNTQARKTIEQQQRLLALSAQHQQHQQQQQQQQHQQHQQQNHESVYMPAAQAWQSSLAPLQVRNPICFPH